MYPNYIRFEHHSFEWLKRLLTASWIAHISTLFSQIPWLKHRQNHVNRKNEKAKQKQTVGRIKRRWISWSKQKTCGNCVSLHQQLRMMPFNSQYTHAHTMKWLNWAKHSNQHGIFEYVMVYPTFFSGYYCYIITPIVMLINKNGFCDLRHWQFAIPFFIQTVYFSFHFFPEYEAMSILLSFAISLSSLVCILFGYSHSFYIFIFPIGTHSIFSSVSFHTDVMLCYNSLTPCLGMAVAFCFCIVFMWQFAFVIQ